MSLQPASGEVPQNPQLYSDTNAIEEGLAASPSTVHWEYNDDGNNDDHDRENPFQRSMRSWDSAESHLTFVTDYVTMEQKYRDSSICTEAVEENGIKDPLGFCIISTVVLVGEMCRGVTFPTLWLFVKSLGGTTVTMGWAVAAFSFGRAITSPIFGHVSVTKGYRFTLLVAGVFLLVGSFLYIQAQSVGRPGFLILAQSVLGIGSGTLGVTRAYVR